MRGIIVIVTAPIIAVILIMLLGCDILLETTDLELYGNEEEMAAYEEGVFHLEDAKGRIQQGPDRERLARNPSERAQRYYFAGDVLIPPPRKISVGEDIINNRVYVDTSFEKFSKIWVFSYRPQEIVIRNMRLVYDQKGIVVPLQKPDKDDVINIDWQYDFEQEEDGGYFIGKSKIYYEWKVRMDDPYSCDKGACFDLQNRELDFDEQETFRLQFEVEYKTEEGEKKTKEFEYKYKYSKKRYIRTIDIYISA